MKEHDHKSSPKAPKSNLHKSSSGNPPLKGLSRVYFSSSFPDFLRAGGSGNIGCRRANVILKFSGRMTRCSIRTVGGVVFYYNIGGERWTRHKRGQRGRSRARGISIGTEFQIPVKIPVRVLPYKKAVS